MIRTKIMSLFAAKTILQKLATVEMPIQDSLKVLRVLKKTQEEFALIEAAQRKLFDKYGEKDEKGNLVLDSNSNNVKIIKEKAEEFSKDFDELLNSEVTLECDKLKYSMMSGLKISPLQLLEMEDFLDNE